MGSVISPSDVLAGLPVFREVFWAEAHDEAQQFIGDPVWVRRRLVALFLLSDRVIFHPSYLWRSDVTRALFFRDFWPLFHSGYAAAILGDSPSTEDYIIDRFARLEDVAGEGIITSEASNYHRNWENIEEEAPMVDARFSGANAGIYTGFRGSKDRRLRSLIGEDLSDDGQPGTLRSELLSQGCVPNGPGTMNVVADYLQNWVLSASFVSRESLMHIAAQNGVCAGRAQDRLSVRLLDLYLRSNVASEVEVPFLQTLQHHFDPYDPAIFELYLQATFGKHLYGVVFEDANSLTLSRMIEELKSDPGWLATRELYFASLTQLNQAWLANSAVRTWYLRYVLSVEDRQFATMVWRRLKFTVLGVIFGVIGFPTLQLTIGTLGGLGGLGLTLWELARGVLGASEELQTLNRHLLRRKMRNALRREGVFLLRLRGVN
jgi:hypothetical protein